MAGNWLVDATSGLGAAFSGLRATPFAAPQQPQIEGFTPYAAPPTRQAATTTGSALSGVGSFPQSFSSLAPFLDNGGGTRQAFGQIPDTTARQAFRPNQMQQAFNQQAGAVGSMAGNSGYTLLDQHNNEINQAASKFGVPANLLKSMINRESSGDWDRDNRVYGGFRNDQILPFVGIFRKTADAWGLNFDAMIGNKQAQIDGMAKILQGLSSQYGGWDNAAKVYFGGEQALNGGFTDELGMSSDVYGQKAIDMWHQLDQKAGFSGGYDVPTYKWGETGLENNGWLQEAMNYVGVQYNWGAIPGANQNPWETGWDCSGMTYWLNQRYGDKSLPMGSHYQFSYAQKTGRLFNDMSQLQPGDLVFADTGFRGGAGAEMNNASHVGIYLGNGQMLHAANSQQGTIVSPISGYNIIGAMHQQGMSGGGGGFGGGGQQFTGWRGALQRWQGW